MANHSVTDDEVNVENVAMGLTRRGFPDFVGWRLQMSGDEATPFQNIHS